MFCKNERLTVIKVARSFIYYHTEFKYIKLHVMSVSEVCFATTLVLLRMGIKVNMMSWPIYFISEVRKEKRNGKFDHVACSIFL
jgi:hypothetical protein